MILRAVLALTLVASAATSAGGQKQDIRKNLRSFELLRDSDLSHSIVKRGADPTSPHKFNKIREVGFNALGREFRDDGLLSQVWQILSKVTAG